MKTHNQQKGFALTEVLLAIAVIVIIGIVVYPLYKNARTSSEVESLANDMVILQTNVQALYSGQSSYANLTASQIDTAGLVPDEIKGPNDAITPGSWITPWGGSITIVPNQPEMSYGLAYASGFTITIASIPQSACTQLINRVAPSFTIVGEGNGSIGEQGYNDASIKNGYIPSKTNVDVSAISNVCTNLYYNNNVAFTTVK